MSFVKGNQNFEVWLDLFWSDYRILKDSEYVVLLKDWRSIFDNPLEKEEYVFKGDKAMHAMEYQLPNDVYIFNFPGYKFLPASTNIGDKVYAYMVKGLGGIDRELFNNSDSIICDLNFQRTCIYTHEWQSLATPKYLEIN